MVTKRSRKRRTIRVGSTVRLRWGVEDVTAEVIEDFGPLGDDGEHIYRVRFWFTDVSEPREIQIEASRLKVVRSAGVSRPRAGARQVACYPALMSDAAVDIPYPRIARDARICGGQPVVAGTRIPVATIVRSQQLGMDFDEILVQYPSLGAADLHAAMLYYLDHRDEIDALLRDAGEPPEGAIVIR